MLKPSIKTFILSLSCVLSVAASELIYSSEGFPIFPTTAYAGTVNPLGIPVDVETGWYEQISQRLAQVGSAKVAYVYANGNAYIVSFSAQIKSSVLTFSEAEFKLVGAWDKNAVDIQFSHPSLNLFSSKRCNKECRKDVR